MARRCPVCGFESAASVCPRCNTIRAADRGACPTCGKALGRKALSCDACGAPTRSEPSGREDREAVRALVSVPGISEDRAKRLVAQGFRDFADVVRLALPERAVRLGLHHTIARKAMLADLIPRPERQVSGACCPTCGAAWLADATRCAACGSSFDLELDPILVDEKLRGITGEVVDLATDPDFQGMPEAIRTEFLQAFGGMNERDLLREECRHQVEAWRAKGFDVTRVERFLEEDLEHFQARSARLIRVQVMKTPDGGRYRCPLCQVLLDRTAEECANCGARFS